MSIVKRIGDIEARRSETIGKDKTQYMEIVQWARPENPYCFTLCSWRKDSEGWSMHCIGGRPFEYENMGTLFGLCKYVQKILDADFELTRSFDN